MDMFDFNTAEVRGDLSELIPERTVAVLSMKLRPGGHGPGGWLKVGGENGSILMADCEFTVVSGQYARRKFWGMFVVHAETDATDGQKQAAEISRSTFRTVLESARQILPADDSADAMAKRKVTGWGDFDGIVFCGKIGIEKGGLKDKGGPANGERYDDKNKLSAAITPDNRAYISPSDPAVVANLGGASAAANASAGAAPAAGAVAQPSGAVTKPDWAN